MRPEPPYTLDLLEDYVNDMLSSEGRKRVESLMTENEEVAAMVAGIRQLKTEQGSTESLANLSQLPLPDAFRREARVRKLWPRLALALTGAAALLLAATFLFQEPSLEEVMAEQLSQPFDMGIVVRGDHTTEIAEAYASEDFERVVELGSKIPMPAMTPNTRLQTGIAMLKTGRAVESLTYLAEEYDSNPLLGEANRWYRGLALVEARRLDEAVEVLEKVYRSDSRSTLADEVLEAIEGYRK